MKVKRSAPDCPICEANSWIAGSHQIVLSHQKKPLIVSDLMHCECAECGYELIFPHQARRNDARLRDARRHADGLLTSSRIKAIRKRLGLSQQHFALLIGCAINTFSKYERGEVTQSAAMDKLLRILDALPEAQDILDRNRKSSSRRVPIYKSDTLQSSVLTETRKAFTSCESKKRIRPFKKSRMIDNATVRRASNKLELRDIALHTCSLIRDTTLDPNLYPISVRAESDVQVAVDQLLFTDEGNDKIPILRAYVRFSLAAFSREDTSGASEIFKIGAEYRVDYFAKKQLTDLEVKAFGDYNAVHNVWAFWRQHVQQTVNQACLPRVTIPLFRQPDGTPRTKRTPRRRTTKKLAVH